MIMCAIISVRAITAEEMDIAHVDFLYSLDFVFIVLYSGINALTEFIPWNLISVLHICWLRCGRW